MDPNITASGTVETRHDRRRTRRDLLIGAGGVAGAIAAQTVLAQPALAGTDGDVILGGSNSEEKPTAINNTAADDAIIGSTNGASGDSPASGLVGSNAGYGPGVRGTSLHGDGVSGSTDAGEAGVIGRALNPNGGTGVAGIGPSGFGVVGSSVEGTGVLGVADGAGGIGIIASKGNMGAPALYVDGKLVTSRSGVVSISYPSHSAVIPQAGLDNAADRVAMTPLVLATMQNSLGGTWVRAAIPDAATDTITVLLNKAPGSATSPKTAHVAWLIVN